MPRKKREGYKTLYIHVTAETKAKLDEIKRICRDTHVRKSDCTQSKILDMAIELLYKESKGYTPCKRLQKKGGD